jgi:hypothetical protein
MKHSAKLIWLFIVFTSQLYSQPEISYAMPQIVGQTPDVASLLKFSETSVSYSTGIPNISIPLCSLPDNDLSVSVGLSYHAGGIRVTEEASSVGLGWNLFAGGKITRTVRSFPDDNTNYGYINSPYTVDYAKGVCDGTINSSFTCAQLTGEQAQVNQYDYEPDDFNYSMMGQSGRFMFNQDRSNNSKGDIVQFPNKNVKITPTFNGSNKIVAWDIIDTNGTAYHFIEGNKFYSSISYQKRNGFIEVPSDGPSISQYTETWDLVSATSSIGGSVNFSYITPDLDGYINSPFNEITCFEGAEALVVQEGNNVPGTSPDLPRRINTLSCTNRKYTLLSEISTALGKIEIIRDLTQYREDTESDKRRIKYVRVYDNHNKMVKEIEFIHDYFISPNPESSALMGVWNIGNIDDSHLYKRMYLKELIFRGESGSTVNEYKYHLNYNTDTMLPNKRSFSQDHWGYYNGKQNASLIQYANNLAAADRESDPEFSDACILESIVYPEGGITEFTYENNQEDPNLVFPLTLKETLKVEALLNNYHIITNNPNSDLYEFIKDFDISIDAEQSTQNSSQTEVNFSGFTSRCGNNDAFFNDDDAVCQTILLKIYERNGSTLGNLIHSDHIWDADTILLERGEEYRAVIEITTSNGDYDFLNEHSEANLEWFVQNTNSPSDYVTINYFGGLRIKEIKNYHRSNYLASHRKYEYEGGGILAKPSYFTVTTGDVRKYVSQSWVPLLTSQSSYVHYEKVTEEFVPVEENQTVGGSGSQNGNGSNGNGTTLGQLGERSLTKRLYNNSTYTKPFPEAPFTYDLHFGLVLEEEIPDLKKTTYTYFDNSSPVPVSVKGFVLNRSYFLNDVSNPLAQSYTTLLNCVQNGGCNIDGSIYTLNSVSKLLKTQIDESLFFDNNNVPSTMTQTKELFYESSNQHLDLPTRITSVGNDNKVYETNVKYPHDVNDLTLISSNRISLPVESSSSIDGLETQKVKRNFSSYSGLYLVADVETSKNSNSLEQRIQFQNYSSNGKPIEVRKKDGTSVFYIYGYQSNYPIAKIDNFTYAESLSIQGLINFAINASNADADRTLNYSGLEGVLRNKLDEIRNHSALANAQMTTYTYDPLVGITSVTDPKGYTVYYDYDDLQRMQYVKDKDGNILSENEYSYRN